MRHGSKTLLTGLFARRTVRAIINLAMYPSAGQVPRRLGLAASSRTTRVYWLSAAEERSFFESLLFFLVLLSFTTLSGSAFWLLWEFDPAVAGLVAGAATLVAGACITLWFLLHLRPQTYEPRHHRALREARLQELITRAQAPGRLPHRALEYYLRERFPTDYEFARLLRRHPFGSAVVVFDRTRRFKAKPTATDAFFEPVRIDSFTPEVRRLVNDLLGSEGETAAGFEPKSWNVTWRGLSLAIRYIFVVTGSMVAVQVMFGDFLSGPWLMGVSTFIGVFLAGNLQWLLPYRREHFVIPGRALVREYRVWERRQVVRPVFPESGRLLLDLRRHRAWIDDGERVHQFPCDPRCAWVLLAAWISRARRPRVEELRAFFGPDAEMVAPQADATPSP